jgi:serine/threonine-protein kinase RsbW
LFREFPSRLKAVEPLCREIRALLQANGLAEVLFPVELSARECLNNAILHGNEGKASRRVGLELHIGRRWIRLQVTDEGRGFPWRAARSVSLQDGMATHGRGLSICLLYAHRVAFNQRGNRITLWLGKTKKEPSL